MKKNVYVCDFFEFENFIDHFFEQNRDFFFSSFSMFEFSIVSNALSFLLSILSLYARLTKSFLFFWLIYECESEFWFLMFLIFHKIRIKKRNVFFRKRNIFFSIRLWFFAIYVFCYVLLMKKIDDDHQSIYEIFCFCFHVWFTCRFFFVFVFFVFNWIFFGNFWIAMSKSRSFWTSM